MQNLYKPIGLPQIYTKENFANLFDPTYFFSCINEFLEIYKIKNYLNLSQFLCFY